MRPAQEQQWGHQLLAWAHTFLLTRSGTGAELVAGELREEASEEIAQRQRHWSDARFLSKGGRRPHEIECRGWLSCGENCLPAKP